MKHPSIESEIRKAVKDYVDSLIAERSKAGRGMALGPNELMAAARAASIKVNTEEFGRSYLKPAINFVTDLVSPEAVNGEELIRPNRFTDVHPPDAAKGDRNKRSGKKSSESRHHHNHRQKKEPHWLTWKTGNTPTSSDVQTSVGRPDSAASRAMTPSVRADTPADPDILDLNEPQLRSVSVVPRINTPYRSYSERMKTPAPSVCNTPIPQRVQTPASLTADYRDPLADRQVAPADIVLKPKTPQNPAYMPALKAWITNANDYERDVAYNLMQVLNTGEPPIARHKTRPRTAVPGLTKMATGPKRNLPKTAGVRTSIPAHWQQIYKDPRHEQYIVNTMAKALERKEPNLTLEPMDDPRPIMRYKYTAAPQYGVVHEGACFMDSQKPYRGSYVINPEWVSELKQSMKHPPQMACSGSKAMKYCSH